MTIKTSYVADDGTIFSTEEECVEYEARKNKQITDEVALLNRVCKFFDSSGKQFLIDNKSRETDVYGINIKCPADEVDDVMTVLGNHFDDLYYALEASDFQTNSEVVLVYDWTGSGHGWLEIDYEKQEWFNMVNKVMGGA
jgi:hypothetical protein